LSYVVQNLKAFPVILGNFTVCLSGCQLSASSTLKESGTADGSFVLSGYWKQGFRLKLTGKLPPDIPPEQVIFQLSQIMLVKQTVTLGKLSYTNAMLCGYTLSEKQDIPELSVLFYCPDAPALIEEVNSP